MVSARQFINRLQFDRGFVSGSTAISPLSSSLARRSRWSERVEAQKAPPKRSVTTAATAAKPVALRQGKRTRRPGAFAGAFKMALALLVGEGDLGLVLQFRFEAGGEGADVVHGGLLGGIRLELVFDFAAFGGGAFAEGVGGQLDVVDGLHGISPKIGRLVGGGFGSRRG